MPATHTRLRTFDEPRSERGEAWRGGFGKQPRSVFRWESGGSSSSSGRAQRNDAVNSRAPSPPLRCMSCYATASELVRAVEGGEEGVGLYLGVCPSESEVAAIARAVGESGKVKGLVLSVNKITDVGASALAEAVVRSTSLTTLHLDNNQITDVGASALAEAVARSTSLTTLGLGYNQITDAGATKLADAVERSASLTALDLGGNRITNVGALSLAKALARSTKLALTFYENRLTLPPKPSSRPRVPHSGSSRAPQPPQPPAVLWRRFILQKDGEPLTFSLGFILIPVAELLLPCIPTPITVDGGSTSRPLTHPQPGTPPREAPAESDV